MIKLRATICIVWILTASLQLCSRGYTAETKQADKKTDSSVREEKASEDDVDILELLELLDNLELLEDLDSLMEETDEK